MKKIVSVILAVLILISTASFASTETPSSWAEESVDKLKEYNLFREEVFTDYKENITRQEFIYLAVRVYEILTHENVEIDKSIEFNDTSDEYALKAATVGISSGIGNGDFGPDALLTREQLAVMMINTLKLADVELVKKDYTFDDEGDFSTWATASIYLAKANGIINGVGENRFACKNNASGETALVIVDNILSRYYESMDFLSYERKSRLYTDYEIRNLNAVRTEVFQNYLENIDYGNPEKFLGHGEQSVITEKTYELVKDINDKQDFTTLMEIYQKMIEYHYKPTPITNKDYIGMNYLNEDYTNEQFLYGCTTYALVYSNMARAKGFPTVLVEGLSMDFINRFTHDLGGGMSGHFFVEVYLDGKWYLIDTTSGRLYLNYDKDKKELPGDNYLWGKGIDKWEFGKDAYGEEIPTPKNMKTILLSENITEYQAPNYDYIDFNTGSFHVGDGKEKVSFISSGMTIIGDDNVTDIFNEKFGGLLGTTRIKAFDSLENDDEALNAIYIAVLINSLEDVPEILLELYPETYFLNEKEATYITKSGRRIAFIKAASPDEINNVIADMPVDFFTNNEYLNRDIKAKAQDYVDGSINLDVYYKEYEGVRKLINGMSAYAFDDGNGSDAFWQTVGYSDLHGGFIYGYLTNNFYTYIEEVEILLISSKIKYENLPEDIRSFISKNDYESIGDYISFELQNGCLIYIIDK